MFYFLITLIVILTLFPLTDMHAEEPDKLINLRLSDGLAGATVTDVEIDQQGLAWIATSNGVSLYNGYNLVTYPIHTENNRPCFVSQIAFDRIGNVYVVSMDGVYKLKRYENDFKRVAPDINTAECILIHNDKIYIGNHYGLFIINSDGTCRAVPTPFQDVYQDYSVRCIKAAADGSIWFTTRIALCRMNPKTEKISYKILKLPTGLSKFDFCKGNVFIGTKNYGLYVYDLQTWQSKKITEVGNVIKSVRTVAQDRVCVSSNGDGAFCLDGNNGKILETFSTKESKNQLPDNGVYSFLIDQSGRRWIGIYNNGLCLTSNTKALFKHFEYKGMSPDKLNVLSFYTDKDCKLIGVHGGFWYVDCKNGMSHYVNLHNFQMQIVNNIERLNDIFYIGTYDHGVVTFNPIINKVSRIPGNTLLDIASILNIGKDRKGRLWVTSSEGLFRIDAKGSIQNYNERNSKIPSGLHNICFDNFNNGWIGTTNGVCIYLSNDDMFKTSDFPKGFFNNEKNLEFTAAHDNMMFAFYQNAVFYTDIAMRKFGRLDIPKSILIEGCYTFVDDYSGRYWMITESGLFCMSYNYDNYRHFGPEYGLIGIPRLLVTDQDTLWVGTDNGVYSVNLKEIDKVDRGIKRAIYPGILFFGSDPANRGKILKVIDTKEISVSWNFSSEKILFRPLASGFPNTDGIFYEYRIDNGKWTLLNKNQAIAIMALMLGKHHLDIRVSGEDDTLTSYVITVYPAVIAWIELLIVLVCIILFFWWKHYRKHTQMMLIEHNETEQALIDELNDRQQESERVYNENQQKYQKSRNNDQILAQIAAKMQHYMQEKKPYLNKDLKMSEVAMAIGTTPSQLSQVFTLYLKENWYDYINKLRLEEFKQLIALGKHKQYTIIALSEQCGFKRTSFFNTFRKVEGITPTEYIQRAK